MKKKKMSLAQTESVADRIKVIRKRKGITQVELARKMGTTQRAISYYENPETNLSLDVLTKIAKSLEIPVKKLLDFEKEEPEATVSSPSLQKKINLISQLPHADQMYISKTIEMLAMKNGLVKK
jgi:transcriptional regulator with XRE-family HTH domain